MTHLVIRGGVVHDGTGAPPRRADVTISGGRVSAVGDEEHGLGRVIDATGLHVSPGFIDFHSHADFTLPAYPLPVNSISQGVTTEVLGNCGLSPAPLSRIPEHAAAYRAACSGLGPDLDWKWSSFAEFLSELDRVRPPVNCVPLVGHNAIRSAVLGFADRSPGETELAAMRDLVATAMEAGAWGLSSGLIYPPGAYSELDELVSLASEAARFGGFYASHIRNEGAGLVAAVEEALDVGRRSGIPVVISHLKAMGVDNYGLVTEALARLDRARDEGVDAFCDVYPYTAASTYLAMLVPPWAHEGGFAELVRRLGSSDVRARIRREMRQGLPGWNSMLRAVTDWSGIVVSSVADPSLRRFEGRSIADVAAAEDKDPFDITFDLLVADDAATVMVAFVMDEDDVHDVVRYGWSVVGSDQLLVTGRERKTHPRAYGSHARTLGPLVRDEGLFSLATAVHKMTGLPARILNMSDRGLLAPGMAADIVLFDPETVTDTADYASPTRPALGVELVLIGGEIAYEGGEVTAPGLGEVLRRRT